ncbi:hypothetical protein EIKCOROL_01618 [Eikenella corrodens ATCC 23834]|uniref:Uncharacterized protein n=1 Tax=Eikenella corrodens ATCC 23834 TaxID=546274 RepID=C0DW69_EIKCO|nr:hypothetical protein EIKCOROL_01618 [Eikenella corrodens ATCC 23834]
MIRRFIFFPINNWQICDLSHSLTREGLGFQVACRALAEAT